ncbi:hypothetical protein C8F01DRAFT_1152259 [Mycena amicta]|nr:hypothetical protein C8F01DRAFT_1152259 [Mycena amicta]
MILPEELFLEALAYVDDNDLLALATVSKHIHDLVLLLHLQRNGVTAADIHSRVIPKANSAVVHSLRMARFVSRVDTLHLRFRFFGNHVNVLRDMAALAKLPAKFTGLTSILLDFPPAHIPRATLSACDTEGVLFALISAHLHRPTVCLSHINASIIRPRRPPSTAIGRLLGRLHLRTKQRKQIQDMDFRNALYVLPLMRGGGGIPCIDIRAFLDVDAPIGTIIILRYNLITTLSFPAENQLSSAEITAIFSNVTLPRLRTLSGYGLDVTIEALLAFFVRHSLLERVALRGVPQPYTPKGAKKQQRRNHNPPPVPVPQTPSLTQLPSDALPQLENILCGVHLAAQLLTIAAPDPQALPNLSFLTVELHGGQNAASAYADVLRGIARRTNLTGLGLHVFDWFPWATDAPTPSPSQITNLRITGAFKDTPSRPDLLVPWLQRWSGLIEITLFAQHAEAEGGHSLLRAIRREMPGLEVVLFKIS